jgi:hypothetical protein
MEGAAQIAGNDLAGLVEFFRQAEHMGILEIIVNPGPAYKEDRVEIGDLRIFEKQINLDTGTILGLRLLNGARGDHRVARGLQGLLGMAIFHPLVTLRGNHRKDLRHGSTFRVKHPYFRTNEQKEKKMGIKSFNFLRRIG